MKTLLPEYPEALETVLNLDEAGFAAEPRMALAVKLFEMGRLSSGQAAALAGVNRVRFFGGLPALRGTVRRLGRRGIAGGVSPAGGKAMSKYFQGRLRSPVR